MKMLGKKILVTGASGFLGGRIVERLILEELANVNALIRTFGNAARIATLPIEFHYGSATDYNQFKAAAEGCDLVFHCASGIEPNCDAKKTSTYLGTVMAAKVCKEIGARLVHISSCSVYGKPKEKDINESFPLMPRHKKDRYALAKIEAEKFLKTFAKENQLDVAILQPTMIYGPHSAEWTVMPLELMSTRNIAMPENDKSICNAVYVDDVVSAAFLAAQHCSSSCQSYLINGNDLPTWTEYMERHHTIGTKGRVVPMNQDDFKSLKDQANKQRSLLHTGLTIIKQERDIRSRLLGTAFLGGAFNLARKTIPEKTFSKLKGRITGQTGTATNTLALANDGMELTTVLPPAFLLELTSQSNIYSIDKARNQLGYRPKYSLDKSFAIIDKWAKWSRLTN